MIGQASPPQVPTPPVNTPPVSAPPAAPIQAPPAGTDLASLQIQLRELQIQLSGLQAQHIGLRRQLDEMLRNNPARPGVQQSWADVGVQIARVQGEIALVDARISAQQG